MVVKKFFRTKELQEYAMELGFTLNLKQGKLHKSKKINGATWSISGFIHSVADGYCNVNLSVYGGEEG